MRNLNPTAPISRDMKALPELDLLPIDRPPLLLLPTLRPTPSTPSIIPKIQIGQCPFQRTKWLPLMPSHALIGAPPRERQVICYPRFGGLFPTLLYLPPVRLQRRATPSAAVNPTDALFLLCLVVNIRRRALLYFLGKREWTSEIQHRVLL